MRHLFTITAFLLCLSIFLPKVYSQSRKHIPRQYEQSFVYSLSDQDIEIYQVSKNGSLRIMTQDSAYIGKYPRCLIATPKGHALYVASDADANDAQSGVIYEFNIQKNGYLKPLAVVDAGCMPFPMTMTTTGSFLYCASTAGATNQGLIYQYRIASNGSLSALTPPFLNLGKSNAVALWVHHSRKYLYAATGDKLISFRINRNGTLARLPSAPIQASAQELALDPSGKYVYLLQGEGIISVATIDLRTGRFFHLRPVAHVSPHAFDLSIDPQHDVLQITEEHTTGHNNWIGGPILVYHILPNGDLKSSAPITQTGILALRHLALDPRGAFANVTQSQ